MQATQPQQRSELSRLTIEHRQRPGGSRRGWVLLAGIVAMVLAASAGAAWWYYRTTGTNIMAALAEQPQEVRLIRVARSDAGSRPIALVANGKIVSDFRVNVATKVSGQIVELRVEQGDTVEQGQVLARIEDDTYQASRDEAAGGAARARSAIVKARADHVRAQAAVVQAKALYEFDKYNFERIERLANTGEASEVEFRNAQASYEGSAAATDVAQAAAESARTAIEVAESELTVSEAVLRRLQKRLDDCNIRAPIAGVILERNAQVGDFLAAEGGRGANANAQLVSIADMSLLRVEIDVSERDVHRVHAGQPARITPDADRTQTYDGKVMWVDPIGDYARAIVQVKVRILDPGPDLRIEGSAKVEFLGPAPKDEAGADRTSPFWLPKAAVKLTPGVDQAEVFTVIDDRAFANRVIIGARTDKSVEIRSGIYEGMQIIAENLDAIEAGSAVRVARIIAAEDL